jgi:putative ABC transport system permease protein
VIWKWATREIRNQMKFSLFFVLNFSIGLIGFLCLDAFKTSLDETFQANAKSLLSADVEVGVRRMLTEAELQKARSIAGPQAQEGRTWELFSMVAAGANSRLVQLKAVDPSYPLYGDLKIESPQGIVKADSSVLNAKPLAWLYPELLTQLDVKVGDQLSLGGRDFTIAGTVAEDGSQGFRMAAMASKIYIGIEQLKQTQLIGYGTTLNDSLLFKVPNNVDSLKVVAAIKKQIEDPAVRVENYQSAAEDSGRTLKYLSDYLGLVSLVALFLAGLGSAYLFRSFIYSRFYQIAILNSLGLSKKRAQLIYLAQLFLLGLGASLISLLGAALVLPVLSEVLKSLSPIAVAINLPLKTMGLAVLMGVFGSLLVGAPFLMPTNRLQTSALLMEGGEVQAPSKWQDFLLFLPGLFLYWGLSVWQAKSLKMGSQFVGLFLGSLVALWIMGWLLLRLFGWLRIQSPWPLRQALLSLSRRKLSSLAIVVSLGLGTLLMNILPQLKVSLQQDLTAPEKIKLPSLFLFDIQDEQLEPLKTFLNEKNLKLQQVSPLVRARILKVNGADFERANDSGNFQTREDESKMRFRNRGVNLTYRDKLTESETLQEGQDFSGRFDPASGKPAEISVEQRFAEQMEFKLHDRLQFDIQGIEIEGEIVNFRSVKWNSFQPNFFIQIQSGVLEEAPKTYLASISALPKDQIQPLQTQMVRQFPNVSMIDVARVIEKVLEVSNQMSWSLELMAALSLFAGFVVLFSIANYEVRKRSWDLNLLKIFGASRKQLFRYLLFEFGLLGFLSSFFGVLVSLVISYLLSRILFEGTYQFNLSWPLGSLVFVTASSLLILYVVSRQVIREKPSELLQQK